jgi:RecA/RadA recombinase
MKCHKSSQHFLTSKTFYCRFDALLNGGLMTGELLEIFGTSGTGKTQLCMTLAANVALYLKKQVFYIDCKNDFSGTRLHSILQAQSVRDEVSISFSFSLSFCSSSSI